MNIVHTAPILLGSVLLDPVGASISAQTIVQQNHQRESFLPTLIDARVAEIIRGSGTPPFHAEEFSPLAEKISEYWSTLLTEGVLEISGTDKEIRPYFVSLQGVIEQVLASELHKNVSDLTGVIHTPMPATPLCTQGEISPELVDPSVAADPARLFTVRSRATVIRDYLFQGGCLYIAYPEAGYYRRTKEQQNIYRQELDTYSDRLFDLPLSSENIPPELIGATYLFRDRCGKQFAFAVNMTQAKNPEDTGHFGLRFGPVDHPAVQEWLRAISAYMEQNGVIDLKF